MIRLTACRKERHEGRKTARRQGEACKRHILRINFCNDRIGGALIENLENVVALVACTTDDERCQCVGANNDWASTVGSGAAKFEQVAVHVVEQRPVFAARPAAAIEPVALLQHSLAVLSRLLRENWTVVFGHHFTLADALDCPHNQNVTDAIPVQTFHCLLVQVIK